MENLRVAIYGAGQVGTNLARVLATRPSYDVLGPFPREERTAALTSGADVVVIATTSFLAAVADDLREAVESGSNVITTAEEAAYPWANDPAIADRIDALAKSRNVTVLGAGLNPGYAFDALVVTACGYAWSVDGLRVIRIVDLSGFGASVMGRLGIGYTPEEFSRGREQETIFGHIGFPQSMHVVAGKLGVEIERIDRTIEPVFAKARLTCRELTVEPGRSAGFEQRYTAYASGEPWFEAIFTGHVGLHELGLEPRDEIHVLGETPLHLTASPGMNPQVGSAAVLANSLRRLVAAPPGWTTVADLPPAYPA